MSAAPPAGRIAAIDVARTVALVNMIAFHFLFDLRMYGLSPAWMSYGPAFDLWARAIAGSFVGLAGVSLWLAHGRGVRWRPFALRLGQVVAGALAVSVATYVAVQGAWVRFGILHSIAASSVIGLVFLRAPAWVTAAVGAVLLVVRPWLRGSLEHPAWLWTGLTERVPPMIDFEPLIPWTGPFLLGIALVRVAAGRGWLHALQRALPDTRLVRALGWPGRHSLSIYLIHQPVLIGLILGWSYLR